MTAHWLAYAEAQHKNLSLELDRLLRDYDLVCSVLGAEWLDKQEAKEILHFHPLYRELSSSTNQGLVTVAELARYLTALNADPALPAVLADLRSEKYPSTLFELASAYRWLMAGARVRLQPPTPAGIADFEAVVSDATFTVECSVTPDTIFQDPSFVLPGLAADTVADVLGTEPFAVAVKITVRKPLAGDWQGDIRRLAKTLCRAVIERVQKGLDTHVAEDSDTWRVEMEKVTDATEPLRGSGWWDISFGASMKPKTEGQPTYKLADEKRSIERARVFLKMPPDSLDTDDFVVKKLQREARQLRHIAGPRVVLLDIAGVTQDVLRVPREALHQRLLKAMRSIPELACVFVMSRGFSTALRFQYRALYFPNPESIYQLPESFLEKLGKQESTWDFLTDREIPFLEKEEAMREWERRSRPSP